MAQAERQVAGLNIGPSGSGRGLYGAILLGVGGGLKALQAVHHGAQLGEIGVVVDE